MTYTSNSSTFKNTETKSPLVSVLMCVYNDEKYVGLAIESILNQSYKNYEFIIVDDGSTDNTSNILKSYSGKNECIKLFRINNSGTTAAANFGLSKVKGKYVARIDSDDISFPERLKIEVEFLERNPGAALIGGGAEIIDVNGNVIGERNIKTINPARTLLKRNIFQQSDVMFRTDVVKNLGGYREKFFNGEDYDLWLRISEKAEIVKLNTFLGQWRLNGSGYSFSRRKEQLLSDKIIKEFAKQRRTSGKDDYDNYEPIPPSKHRQNINDFSYDIWVALYLIESFRKKEARSILLKNFKKFYKSPKIYFLMFLTFLPKFILNIIFSVRTFIKNNF